MRVRTLLAIVCTASLQISFAANPASDNAADPAYNKPYPQWVTGDNGGQGFGPWTLTTVNNGGFFTGSSTNNGGITSGGIDSLNTSNALVSWGLWANSNAGPAEIVGYRPFTGGSLNVGQTFEIYMDNGYNDGVVGFVLRTGNDTTSKNNGQRFEFLHVHGAPTYAAYSTVYSNSTVGYTEGGLKVAFTLTGADTFSVTITDLTGNASQTITGALAGTSGSGIDSVALYDENTHSDASWDLYFNKMSVGDFGVKAAQLVDGTNAVVAFGTSTNAVYNIETNSDLTVSSGWTPLVSNVAGNGGTIVMTNSVPDGTAQLFYRVRMTLP